MRSTDQAGNTDPTPAAQSFTTAKRLTANVKATSGGSKLRVDVNPNSSAKNSKIKVRQRKNAKWKMVKVTQTNGSKDKRTINLGRGKYRVVVPTQHGMLGTKSEAVRLRR